MNRNSKSRRAGQWAQGNNLYLTAYQKGTKKVRKLALSYSKAELGIDGDLDKLEMVFESELGKDGDSRYYVFALYDLQRVVFIQFNDKDLFLGKDEDAFEQVSQGKSSVSASSYNSKYLSENMMSGVKKGAKNERKPPSLKTRVYFYDDLLQGKTDERTQSGPTKTLREQLIDNPDIDWDADDS